eukprot:TRINITY_DN2749_c0_g1_i2.p1 TRINITY_DN2749_c0_g1~~TRINITY_DN2749_c0_g1_i2.p1  ORF type:complete len:1003 (-),score=246.90 TRINITY_DN2749_c0_g1_i2:97-3105(-)
MRYLGSIAVAEDRREFECVSCTCGESQKATLCEHVVASLLICIHRPHLVENSKLLDDEMDKMDINQLKQLLLRQIIQQPQLIDCIRRSNECNDSCNMLTASSTTTTIPLNKIDSCNQVASIPGSSIGSAELMSEIKDETLCAICSVSVAHSKKFLKVSVLSDGCSHLRYNHSLLSLIDSKLLRVRNMWEAGSYSNAAFLLKELTRLSTVIRNKTKSSVHSIIPLKRCVKTWCDLLLQWPGSANERKVWGYELAFDGFEAMTKPARDAAEIGWDSSLLQFVLSAQEGDDLFDKMFLVPSLLNNNNNNDNDNSNPWKVEDYEREPEATLVREEPPIVRARLTYLRKNKLLKEATNLCNFVALQVYHAKPSPEQSKEEKMKFMSTAFKYLKIVSPSASLINSFQIVQTSLETLCAFDCNNVRLFSKWTLYWSDFVLRQYKLSSDASSSSTSQDQNLRYSSFRTTLKQLCERRCGEMLIDAENQKEVLSSVPDGVQNNLILETTVQLFARVISDRMTAMSVAKEFEKAKLYHCSYRIIASHIEKFIKSLNELRWIVNIAIQCGRPMEVVKKLVQLQNSLSSDDAKALTQQLIDAKVYDCAFKLNLETYHGFNFDRVKLLVQCFPKLSPEMAQKKTQALQVTIRGIPTQNALELNEILLRSGEIQLTVVHSKQLLRVLQNPADLNKLWDQFSSVSKNHRELASFATVILRKHVSLENLERVRNVLKTNWELNKTAIFDRLDFTTPSVGKFQVCIHYGMEKEAISMLKAASGNQLLIHQLMKAAATELYELHKRKPLAEVSSNLVEELCSMAQETFRKLHIITSLDFAVSLASPIAKLGRPDVVYQILSAPLYRYCSYLSTQTRVPPQIDLMTKGFTLIRQSMHDMDLLTENVFVTYFWHCVIRAKLSSNDIATIAQTVKDVGSRMVVNTETYRVPTLKINTVCDSTSPYLWLECPMCHISDAYFNSPQSIFCCDKCQCHFQVISENVKRYSLELASYYKDGWMDINV